jgi:hypothetical protein
MQFQTPSSFRNYLAQAKQNRTKLIIGSVITLLLLIIAVETFIILEQKRVNQRIEAQSEEALGKFLKLIFYSAMSAFAGRSGFVSTRAGLPQQPFHSRKAVLAMSLCLTISKASWSGYITLRYSSARKPCKACSTKAYSTIRVPTCAT